MVFRLIVFLLNLLKPFRRHLLLLLLLQAVDLSLPHETFLHLSAHTIFARFFCVILNALKFCCAATMCSSNLILPSSLSYSIQLKLEMLCCISIWLDKLANFVRKAVPLWWAMGLIIVFSHLTVIQGPGRIPKFERFLRLCWRISDEAACSFLRGLINIIIAFHLNLSGVFEGRRK